MQISSDYEDNNQFCQENNQEYVFYQHYWQNQEPLFTTNQITQQRAEPQVTRTQTMSDIVNPNQQKMSFKNFPKLLGNTLVKKTTNTNVPQGIKTLIEKRKKTRQSKLRIQDLQDVCKTDEASKQFFQNFVEEDMFIHALHSNKIENPILLIPAISNYWAAAQEPDKMISNSLMNKYFQP